MIFAKYLDFGSFSRLVQIYLLFHDVCLLRLFLHALFPANHLNFFPIAFPGNGQPIATHLLSLLSASPLVAAIHFPACHDLMPRGNQTRCRHNTGGGRLVLPHRPRRIRLGDGEFAVFAVQGWAKKSGPKVAGIFQASGGRSD